MVSSPLAIQPIGKALAKDLPMNRAVKSEYGLDFALCKFASFRGDQVANRTPFKDQTKNNFDTFANEIQDLGAAQSTIITMDAVTLHKLQ